MKYLPGIKFLVSAVALLSLACKTIETLHAINFARDLDNSPTVIAVGHLTGHPAGAALISVVVTALTIICWRLWRENRTGSRTTFRTPEGRKKGTIIEEREEIHHTRVTRTIIDE